MWWPYVGGVLFIIMGCLVIWAAITTLRANKAAPQNVDNPESHLWTPAEQWLWIIGFGLGGLGLICLGVTVPRYAEGSFISIPVHGPLLDQIISVLAIMSLVGGFLVMLAWGIANSVAKAQQGTLTYERLQSRASSAFESTSEERIGQLLARSATTGWFDWFHGELWLFPEGLLRIPIGVAKTLLFRGYIPVSDEHTRVFSASEFASQSSNSRNLWISADQIETARLGHTFGADELRVTLRDGRNLHLLWLPSSRIFKLLQERIHEWGLTQR